MISPAELFTLLSDQTRLRCMLLLIKEKEICVCEFCNVLNFIQPKISRHLAYLRKSGLILDVRREQWVYYKLNNKLPAWCHKILTTISNELENKAPFKLDAIKTNTFKKNRPCKNLVIKK